MNCILGCNKGIQFVRAVNGYEIMKCMNCGLTFSLPMKSKEDYSQEVTHDRWEFNIVLEILKNLDNPKVFELGCGDGRFLLKLQKIGLDCYGLDINKQGVLKAIEDGVKNVFHGYLNQDFARRFANYFDIIFGFHVLEHIENINDTIKLCKIMLKENGFLVFSVPSPDRLSSRIFKEDWDNPPYHLTRWTKKALTILLENNGFRVVDFIEEPLNLKSAYIYIVDTQILIRDVLLKFKKTSNLNSTSNPRFGKKVKIKKAFFGFSFKVISYLFGILLFSCVRLFAVIFPGINKGLSLVVVAKKE